MEYEVKTCTLHETCPYCDADLDMMCSNTCVSCRMAACEDCTYACYCCNQLWCEECYPLTSCGTCKHPTCTTCLSANAVCNTCAKYVVKPSRRRARFSRRKWQQSKEK